MEFDLPALAEGRVGGMTRADDFDPVEPKGKLGPDTIALEGFAKDLEGTFIRIK